jgi:hypothetical protein
MLIRRPLHTLLSASVNVQGRSKPSASSCRIGGLCTTLILAKKYWPSIFASLALLTIYRGHPLDKLHHSVNGVAVLPYCLLMVPDDRISIYCIQDVEPYEESTIDILITSPLKWN